MVVKRAALAAFGACVSSLTLLSSCQNSSGTVGKPDRAYVAEEVAVLSESETAGPLFGVRGLVAKDRLKWVLDAGNSRVLVIQDENGPLVFGREGIGPGEFKAPEAIFSNLRDGVSVWERSLLRLTAISADIQLERTDHVNGSFPGLSIVSAYPIERGYALILNKSLSASNPPPKGTTPRPLLLRVDEAFETRDTLAILPEWGPIAVWTQEGGGVSLAAFSPPFDAPAHSSFTAACGGLLAISVGGRGFRIELFDGSGSRVATLEDTIIGDPINEAEREAYFARFDTKVRRRYDLNTVIDVPQRHPAIQDLQLTSDGHLWVRVARRADGVDRARWRVWPIENSRQATRLGASFDVLFPRRVLIYDVDADTVWGVHRDTLDVPTLRGYTIPVDLPAGCVGVQ